MSEFQKIKVSTDEGAFENALANYEGRIEFYQNTINLIKDIKPDFVFASNDLKFFMLFSGQEFLPNPVKPFETRNLQNHSSPCAVDKDGWFFRNP